MCMKQNKLCEKSVCIEDFCGRFSTIYPFQYWADYCPVDGKVYFGGYWQSVKPWKVDNIPTESALTKYAWERALEAEPEVALHMLPHKTTWKADKTFYKTFYKIITSRYKGKYKGRIIQYDKETNNHTWL